MRYFKIVLACFGFILAVVGITAGVLFLTGKFDKEVIQPGDIAFEITEKLTENDFEVVVNTTTENVTEKDVTLSLTNQTEADGMISDGIITIPKVVKLGKPFTVKVNKTHYAGMTEEWNVGGTSIIRAKSTNPLIQEATPLTVEVDVPVHSLGVELVTTTGTKIGTVSARNLKNYMKTLAEGEEDKKVVELAVGSVVRLQPVFTPAKSAKTTKGEPRKVLFEIPTAWKGIHIDFVDGENDLIEVLRQTTVEDIKINAYCFRTSADEYVAQSKGYSDEELITMMNSNGISGASSQIFGTNQKITSFTSSTNDEYMNLAINSPMTLVANGNVNNAFNLGLGLASDAGVAKLEDKIAVIKLFAYWQNGDGAWEDAGDKLEIVGQTSSKKENGVKAKINKNNANLSSWKVIASETGKYKIVAKLSYEYYSSSSSVPTEINFEIPFNNILVADPISSDVAWKSTLPAIKTLVVLDGETAAEKYYPTINLADFVDIKNPNATYKVVRFFAYSTEGENLANVINCSIYSGNFAVPDSSNQYEVFEIPNGILTAKDVGNFRIFFATVVSDYMGNPKIQSGGYLFESFSNTNTINVVKSLKQLDASMTVNPQEDGKDYNKNTDETTRDYIFHVRQQDEKVFTLSLFVSDIEIFERDYADGKISIDFLLDGQKSKILELTGDYVIDVESKRIDFQVSVKSLPNNDQPTLECKVTYDLDHRLDKFVSNNGNKVQIKVLNGFAQEIVFDAVKDAYPKNSAENPIQVEIKFNAGSDNIATNIEYEITLNGQKLILEDLSKVTINDEALNRNYTLSSSKPAVIAIEDSLDGAKLSILGSTEDEDVVVTATAADGSGLTANLYFRVLASLQITLTPNKSEITMDGYQGNQMNFRTYFDAKAGDIDLNNLLKYNVPIDNTSKFAFADDTLKIVSTLGRDASLQLYITSDFGFTKIVPIRIVSNISASSTYAFNDQGLDDSDFVARGETPPTERGTRVYAENSREISFVLTQEEPTPTNIAISVDDFELPKNGGIQNISYSNGILTVCFDAVSQMTEKTIIFKKNFSENDEYAFVYTMKFLVFPNIKASLVSNLGTEEKPADYISGETVIYDAKDNSNGLIKLERILGSSIISEHATLEARINGEWVALSSNSGVFTLPTSFRATEGSFVEIRITYDGCVLSPVKLFFKPFFDESILLDAKVLYGGKLYVPFIANGENSITLNQAEGVVYTIINATSEQYLRIRGNQIEKLDRLYTKIITSEKLRIENGNGATELPILILPIKYPFVVYDSIENAQNEETYRTVDLKQVIESDSFYDTLEAGSDETIDLKSKILVDGLESGGALVSVINADGSANNYVNYDAQNLTISANSVGKDQIVYVKVKCGAEFEEAFEFVYRIKINANQQIKVFYPYIEYNEEYNPENAYEFLYFGLKNQTSINLMEEFDANKTPNKDLLEALFATTNGKTFARRFVVVREKDGKLIPLDYKDFHFEIASVGIGKTVIPADQVSNYAVINESTTTDGVLQSANLLINRGQATETIYVTIRAYTASGAEAFYRIKVGDNPVSYKTYYKNQRITSDDYSVASFDTDINLNESVIVKIDENPEQVVSPNSYKFYLIVNEKVGTDYKQFIELVGGHIRISTLVNDVETTVVIYNAQGEISRFKLVLKCTIDHEVKASTVGANGVYEIGKDVEFYNTSGNVGNYIMQEISTELYVRNYLNGTDIGTTNNNNLFVNVGGYSIKDISKDYKQYVLLDNIKVYAENLFDTWGGKFYLGEEAKYDILTDYEGKYIRFNGSVIRIRDDKYFDIPLQSTTDKQKVTYEISYDEKTLEPLPFVIIPHLKFLRGNDTRDYVLFDQVVYARDLGVSHIEPYGETYSADRDPVASCSTYVYAYVNSFIRYKIEKGVNKEGKTDLKVSILRITHNDVQYNALVDENHGDNEYILINDEKHYFTRFYTINFKGIAENSKDENGKDVVNVPKVRYMLTKDEQGNYIKEIDLRNIIFYMQEDKSDNVLKLGAEGYTNGMFQFYKNGEETQIDGWTISINDFSAIDIEIKDTTGKYVVGRLTILPTVETSTSEKNSNQTVFIGAGSTDIDYEIWGDSLGLNSYKESMSKYSDIKFTGSKDDHKGWSGYVYNVSSKKYTNLLSIDDNGLSIDDNGQISGFFKQAPWGDVTVEARLQYKKDVKLANTIPYATWSELFFGKNTSSYADLVEQQIAVKAVKIDDQGNEEIVEISENGDIVVPYGDYTLKIVLGQICPCGEFVKLGDNCTYLDMTELKTEPSKTYTSLDELNAYEKHFSSLNANKEITIPKVGKVTLDGTLTKGENGQWILNGKISLFEFVQKSFTASNLVKTTKTEEFDVVNRKIVLPNGAKNPKIADESLTFVYDVETSTLTFDESVDLTGISKVSVTYEIAIIIENAEKEQKIQKYNLADHFKSLFDADVLKFVDAKTWQDLLNKCEVKINGAVLDETDVGLIGNGENTKFTFEIKTIAAIHTGTFYIVNQEYDKSKLHGTGNLSNIGYSLKDYVNYFDENGEKQEEEQDIKSVVNVGTVTEGTKDNQTEKTIWVIPVQTTKYLSQAKKDELFGNIKTLWNIGTDTQGWSTSDLFAEDRIKLTTAAELADKRDSENNLMNCDPFNTATIYQHGYAIGNIHIYLEDYVGDNTASKWKIYYSTYRNIHAVNINNGKNKIEFAIDEKDRLTTTLEINEIKEISEQISDIDIFTEDQKKTLSQEGRTVEITENDKSLKHTYKLAEGATLEKDKTSEVWKLTGLIIKTTATENVRTIYLTKNAVLNDNKYLFDNGLLLEWDKSNSRINLKKAEKTSETEVDATGNTCFNFIFEEVVFKAVIIAGGGGQDDVYNYTSDKGLVLNYFEGLKDRVEQPTNSEIQEGSKTYKAEKTGNSEDDSDVVYKDKIEGNEFNFDNWEYSATYKNESGQTIQTVVKNKQITITGLNEKDKQIKITINGITDAEGNVSSGGYTFVVDLDEESAVTVIGGNESITSPDTPLDGGVITCGQDKKINLNDEVFNFKDSERKIEINYDEASLGDLGVGTTLTNEQLIDVLFGNAYVQYLVGSLGDDPTSSVSSNVFKIANGEIYIIFNQQEYKIIKTDEGYALEDESVGKFTLSLDQDLYKFEGKVVIPEDKTEKGVDIAIMPVFTFDYKVESNITLIDINDKGDEENGIKAFAESGILAVKGGKITTESVVKLRFAVLRGRKKDAKEIAFAYYSLSLKPSVGAVITYPTISTSTKDENGNFVAVGQTTEYFYAGAGTFGINDKADISIDDKPRMKITKYAYGTATTTENGNTTTYPCVATYEGLNLTIIKIGERNVNLSVKEKTGENWIHVANDGTTEYTISVYTPKITISYIASSSQNIIKGKDESGKNILTNYWKDVEGKFNFEFDDKVSISEAEVVISAQAIIGDYTYTFAQYTFTVCKQPVISTFITTEEGHLDGNGSEILPINGECDIKPFDAEKDGNIVVGEGENQTTTPRLQFVYNNLILSSRYEDNFGIKGETTIKIRDYSILQATTGKGTVYFVYKGQDVSGSYSYETKWDYRMNPNLDSHTIDGNYVDSDAEHKELLNYYYLKAGKTYNIIEAFGLTKYFSTKSLKRIFGLDYGTNVGTEDDVRNYEGVEFTADMQSINVLGAPESGKSFRIKFKPYCVAADIVVGITILPSIEINVNYQTETIYENDPYLYGLISYNQVKNNEAYPLISNAKGTDFTIQRDGVIADVVEGQYKFEIVEGTDETLNAKIEHSGSSATLTIANPPKLNSKRVVIKVSDNYGYYQYLRYVIGASTQVVISSSDITFTTGEEIEWENNQFPISFKKSNEETIQLASFYEADITSATSENTSDNYGSDSSLKVEDGKLYGVQLGSVITYTTSVDESEVSTYYIPYNGKTPISYDVYKLIAKSGDNDKVLKSFSNYKKQVVKGDGKTLEKCIDSTTGAFTPQKKDATSYYDIYVIELYARENSKNPDATMTFKVLEVRFTDNLYYASRANPSDCYTFEYEIKINGEGESIVAGKTIKDIGNSQYGSASSLNTTLKITVKSKVGDKSETLDNIDIGILLKFGIYPEVKQNFNGQINYDYVGRGDDIYDIVTKNNNIKLTSLTGSGSAVWTKAYYTVLGDDDESSTSTLTSKLADKMTGGTLDAGNYSYDGNTRVLSLNKTFDGNKAELNNILYTYTAKTASASAKLKIGYKEVDLDANNTYVDDVTGITYQVKDNKLFYVSKKVDNTDSVIINNKKYVVGDSNSVSYETLYESVFIVWTKDNSPSYWAQWNYKVVDKFNQVTTGDPLEAQDGNIKVKLDWKSEIGYTFNPNTLKLYANNSELGTAKWISELNDNRYEIKINGTTYKIVLVETNGSTTMKFIDSSNNYYKPDNSNDLALTEDTTKNSSWADKITLTGLDGKLTSLRVAENITIKVNGSEPNDKYTISDDLGLLGKTMNVEIDYTNGIGEGTDPVPVKLLFNGNDIKVTFEHFDPTKSN